MLGRCNYLLAGIAMLAALACTAAFAQNPIQNPSFENGLTGWSTYTFGSGQQYPIAPRVGPVGENPANEFHVLYPSQGAADGVNICGQDGWYDARTGGVYQAFTALGSGSIVITARAFSWTVDQGEVDMGNRVRAAVVSGTVTDRSLVPFTGPNAWKKCAWGANWNDIVIPVTAAGTYTLFIEGNIVWDNCVYTNFWDNVRFEAVPEPASILALLVGIVGLGTTALRCRK